VHENQLHEILQRKKSLLKSYLRLVPTVPLLAQKVMPIMNQIPCSLKNAWDTPALRLLNIVQHWSGFSVLIHDGSVPSRNCHLA
jgi:hypothetical protein